MQPIHLIVNPHSGYGQQQHLLADLRAAMRQAGMATVEYVTTGPADATRYAGGLPPTTQAVVVVGGDGTVSEVVNALSGSEIPILPCPVGTENLLAKDLGISANARRIVEILQCRRIIECDVGRINGRIFLLIIGVGFDGEVVRRLAKVRTGHISHLSYFWPIWRTFWEHDFPRLRIVADGQEIFNDPGLAFVGNISRYAAGLRICRDAKPDDGLLDLVVFGCRARPRLVLHAGWTLLRRHPLKGDVIYHQFKRLLVESDSPVPSQVDGDVGPSTPLEVQVLPSRVRLLVPPPRRSFWPWREVPI
ncbi:MAG: NAD(+)/NADH kinase [Planctomycetes bacterium]|nr:NAD(+)/NADH kinase [Planctomycetota bacterium]